MTRPDDDTKAPSTATPTDAGDSASIPASESMVIDAIDETSPRPRDSQPAVEASESMVIAAIDETSPRPRVDAPTRDSQPPTELEPLVIETGDPRRLDETWPKPRIDETWPKPRLDETWPKPRLIDHDDDDKEKT